MTTKPKPIKPRKAWVSYSHGRPIVHDDYEGAVAYLSDTPTFLRDPKERIVPVLAIDLSPESVAALVKKMLPVVGHEWGDSEDTRREICERNLAAIGIRPSWRRR